MKVRNRLLILLLQSTVPYLSQVVLNRVGWGEEGRKGGSRLLILLYLFTDGPNAYVG